MTIEKKCTDPEIGALLHAYELRALNDQDEEKFEQHLLACEFCFEKVRAFEAQAEQLTEDAEIKAMVRESVDRSAGTKDRKNRLLEHLWPAANVRVKPIIVYLLLVLIAVAFYSGFNRGDRDRVIRVQTIALVPLRSSSEAVLDRSLNRDGLIEFVYADAVPGEAYRVEIVDDLGRVVVVVDDFDEFDRFETGRLLFPRELMRPGQYELKISPEQSPTSANTQIYHFQIK